MVIPSPFPIPQLLYIFSLFTKFDSFYSLLCCVCSIDLGFFFWSERSKRRPTNMLVYQDLLTGNNCLCCCIYILCAVICLFSIDLFDLLSWFGCCVVWYVWTIWIFGMYICLNYMSCCFTRSDSWFYDWEIFLLVWLGKVQSLTVGNR